MTHDPSDDPLEVVPAPGGQTSQGGTGEAVVLPGPRPEGPGTGQL